MGRDTGAADIRIVRGDPTDDEIAAVLAVLGAVLTPRPDAPQAPPRRRVRRTRVSCAAVRRRAAARR